MKGYYKIIALTITLGMLLPFMSTSTKAAIGAVSISGSNITSQAIGTNQSTTVNLGFLSSSPYFDDEEIVFDVSGFTVGTTLTVGSISLSAPGGCSNSLEAWPGTPSNSTHEVRFSNNTVGDDDPIVIISLDNGSSCAAGNWTLNVNTGLSSYATPGNYTPSVYSPEGGASTLLYVGGANQVEITASVSSPLSFSIRNSSDTGGDSSCNLGNLSQGGVQSCSYRLKAESNFGHRIIIDSDGPLRKSNGADINYVTDGSVSTNSEEYGIRIQLGSLTSSSSISTGSSWATGTDNNPNPAESGSEMIDANGANFPGSSDTTHTHLITHRAEAGNSTQTGSYSQNITYTLIPDF